MSYFEKLYTHLGHEIVLAKYRGINKECADICLKCETCNMVLFSAVDFDGGYGSFTLD